MFGYTGDVAPEFLRFVVFLVDGDPEILLVKAEPPVSLRGGEKLPRIGNGALFEIVAKREVSIHLEERAVSGGFSHLFDIEGSNTFLHARGPRIRCRHNSREIGNERDHARDCEHEGWIIAHQGR